jgi:hypothetical protein
MSCRAREAEELDALRESLRRSFADRSANAGREREGAK